MGNKPERPYIRAHDTKLRPDVRYHGSSNAISGFLGRRGVAAHTTHTVRSLTASCVTLEVRPESTMARSAGESNRVSGEPRSKQWRFGGREADCYSMD
jgi:hypothetical protein